MAKNNTTVDRIQAIWNFIGGDEGANGIMRGEFKLVRVNILESVGTVKAALTTGKFVAKEKFVQSTKSSAKVQIYGFGSNFENWFLAAAGKIEIIAGPHPVLEVELRYQKLIKDSVDAPIIAELGGEEKAETTLAELYAQMEKQGHGKEGVLHTNGWWNVFYIRDISGVLRAVLVWWGGDGWHAYARSVDDPNVWCAGSQVFSRNS